MKEGILGKMVNLAFTRLLTLYNTTPKRHDVATTMKKRREDLTKQEEVRNLMDSPVRILRNSPVDQLKPSARLNGGMDQEEQAISKCWKTLIHEL